MQCAGCCSKRTRLIANATVVAVVLLAGVTGYLVGPGDVAEDSTANAVAPATLAETPRADSPDASPAPGEPASAEEPEAAEGEATDDLAALGSDDARAVLEGCLRTYFRGDYANTAKFLTGKAAQDFDPDKDRSGTEYVGFEITGDPVIINEAYVYRVTLRWNFQGMEPLDTKERYSLVRTPEGWRISDMPGFP